MSALIAFIRAVDAVNEVVGRVVAWLTFGTVAVCFLVVVLRYVFSIGFIWLQELYVWQHAVVFMLGAGYTLLHGGHVRVDIFYARMDPRRRAVVDLFGTFVFLLPWLGVVIYYGMPFQILSWRLLEPSSQSDGLPGFFLLKSVIPAFCVLVGLQGLAIAARSILVLAGREEYAPAQSGH
ncbi:MAG: putative transporter, DctQ-like rane protein [Rhodospirillales bacterium]|jgi:TRAP-type mannitol/chloroaromatic compound transport system permease small subunit|nr:putative transporter, DctQ-like rane protein [Rhodospirillales bacterium]